MNAFPTPTPRELELLKILWEQGPSSVREVHRELLVREPELAYNTVQTLLRIMADKQLVGYEAKGRAFIYTAKLTREENTTRFLEHVFDGAVSQLVHNLLENEKVSSDELERMHKMIADARRRRPKR